MFWLLLWVLLLFSSSSSGRATRCHNFPFSPIWLFTCMIHRLSEVGLQAAQRNREYKLLRVFVFLLVILVAFVAHFTSFPPNKQVEVVDVKLLQDCWCRFLLQAPHCLSFITCLPLNNHPEPLPPNAVDYQWCARSNFQHYLMFQNLFWPNDPWLTGIIGLFICAVICELWSKVSHMSSTALNPYFMHWRSKSSLL